MLALWVVHDVGTIYLFLPRAASFFFFFEQMVLLGAVSLTESAVSDFFFHVLRADSKRSRDLSESSFILCPYKRFIYTSQVTMSHGFSLL